MIESLIIRWLKPNGNDLLLITKIDFAFRQLLREPVKLRWL